MKRQAGITLITLAVTIIILAILAGVSINTLIGDNGIITKARQAKENFIYASQEEQDQLNELYWEMDQEGIHIEEGDKDLIIESLREQVEELEKQLADIQNQLSGTTATASHILKDYTAYSGGQLLTGTMPNNGAVSSSLNCGEVYNIPEGYHNGSGTVIANSLESQTQATATAGDLASGKTAWVNGQKLIGSVEPLSKKASGWFIFSCTETKKIQLSNLIPNHTYILVIFGKTIGSYKTGWYDANITATNAVTQEIFKGQWGDGDSGYSQGYLLSIIPSATTMEVSVFFGGGSGWDYHVDYFLLG